jgi:hypothetical protein
MEAKPQAFTADRPEAIGSAQIDGGPREGRGGAVALAMCAAATGCSAWASALGGMCGLCRAGGGTVAPEHSGHSMCKPGSASVLWPSAATMVMPLEAEHTICHDEG